MEIPQNIQDQLKCSECAELLSCGPVYMLHETGGVICGRCHQQPEETDSTRDNKRSRIVPYEATAALLAFPCPFSSRGCPEKLKFSMGQSLHELNCEFRPFACPIAAPPSPRGACKWIGPCVKLKEHCDEEHPENILANPGLLPQPNLTATNLQSYLVTAFRFLFLLQIKVNVASGNLFHSVRMFGDSKFLDRFRFTLEMEGNNVKVTKSGSVLHAGILTLQEPTAICTPINNLLAILDGKYNESEFKIKIQALFTFCANCFKYIEDDFDSKFCDDCAKYLQMCCFHEYGCLFADIDAEKCWKHENYFCKYQTNCSECVENFSGDDSCIDHLFSSSFHTTMKSSINSVVRVTPNTSVKYNFILFSSKIICRYILSDFNFQLYLLTSLPSHKLKNYKCSIKLTDPQTKYTEILTPQIKYNDWSDWYINEKMDNFLSWKNTGIDMKINIDKI